MGMWAWQFTPPDASRLDWVWALQIYQMRRGLWRDQIDWTEEGLEIARADGRREDEGILLNNIGAVYYSLGQREVALDYYQRALPIVEEVGDRYGQSITRYNMAMIYREQGRLAEAVAELKRVVELDRLVQHPDLKSPMAMLAQVEAELTGAKAGRWLRRLFGR